MKKFGVGTKAYIDCFSGLVPCEVVDVLDFGCVLVRVTANRGAYRKGEVLQQRGHHVPPREMVRRRKYGNRILTGYQYDFFA